MPLPRMICLGRLGLRDQESAMSTAMTQLGLYAQTGRRSTP
jgi:hypothetical protein